MHSISRCLTIFWCLSILLMGACSPQAPAPAASMPVPTSEPIQAATTAVVLPTATSTATPTVAPTVAPSPSPLPDTPTPKPTRKPSPAVSLETLVGLWSQFDDDAGGYNWLLYNEDGTYVARHGPSFDTGVHVAEGSYTLEENLLTLFEPNVCAAGETFQLRFITSKMLRYDVAVTTCEFLADDFQREPIWERAE